MMHLKFALVFMVVLVVYLQQSQGHVIHKKTAKLALVGAKVGLVKSVSNKIKLAALKKWGVVKAIAKAPFVLGKKSVLLKLGVAKSLAALKLAKAKKMLGLASKKAAPAVEAIGTVTKKVGPVVAAVAGIPAAAAAAAIPVIAGIPDAIKPSTVSPSTVAPSTASPVTESSSTMSPSTESHSTESSSTVSPSKPETPVTEAPEITAAPVSPSTETKFQIVVPDAHYSSNFVNSYNEHGYSVNLLPGAEYSSVYQYFPKYDTDKLADGYRHGPQTDTKVVAPHDTYGVPK